VASPLAAGLSQPKATTLHPATMLAENEGHVRSIRKFDGSERPPHSSVRSDTEVIAPAESIVTENASEVGQNCFRKKTNRNVLQE